jgi:hypothetical protein
MERYKEWEDEEEGVIIYWNGLQKTRGFWNYERGNTKSQCLEN